MTKTVKVVRVQSGYLDYRVGACQVELEIANASACRRHIVFAMDVSAIALVGI